MRSFHTSDVELGCLATKARPGLLALTHIVRMGGSDAELLAGAWRGGFSGQTILGRDPDRFQVG